MLTTNYSDLLEMINQQLQSQIVEARERERNRISSYIHCEPLGDLFHVIRTINETKLTPEQKIEAIKPSCEELLEKLRGVCHNESTMFIKSCSNLFDYIYVLLLDAEKKFGITATGSTSPELSGKRFNQDEQAAIYRVAQLAINNICKHAEAKNVQLVFEADGDDLVLKISDDGRGFKVPRDLYQLAGQQHYGLADMATHVQAFGGQLNIKSRPGRGTTVEARFPMLPPMPEPSFEEYHKQYREQKRREQRRAKRLSRQEGVTGNANVRAAAN